MEARAVTPEQQIRSVRDAVAKLRGLKRFRGQDDLVRDAEGHLVMLQEAHRLGKLQSHVPSNG